MPADYPALADLWHDSWQSIGISNETDLSREGVHARFLTEVAGRWTLYLAEQEAQPVGMLALVPAEHRLDQIFVAPSFKGQGIGRDLLDFAKREMPDRIVLWTAAENRPAREFYAREGFVLKQAVYDASHRRRKCCYVWMPDASGRMDSAK